MNKKHKLIFTIACLLTAIGAHAYKIEEVKHTNGSITGIKYGSSATAVEVNVTDIPSHETVTMTVTPDNGYYLSALEYEEVTSLDQAMAPHRADRIQPVHQITVNTTNATYIAAHYGGTYSFTMPKNNVIIRATFTAGTNVSGITLTWDNDESTRVYDGVSHGILVKHGETTLTAGTHYNSNLTSQTNVYDGNPVITGYGTYYGTHNTTNLKITAATLTVTADDKTKEYLDANPELTVSYSGFRGSDNANNCLTTSPVLTTTATESSPASVSTYPINFSTNAVAPNYSINHVSGNLTITNRNIGSTSTKGQAEITLSKADDEGFFNTNKYFKHTGSVQTPTVTVKYGENTLVEGISNDYTLATTGHYTDATDKSKPDIYTITVTFTGNYTGTKTVEYQIRPELTLNGVNGFRWRTFYEQTYNMGKDDNYFLAYTISNVTTNAVVLDGPTVIKAEVPMVLYRTSVTDSGIYPPLIKTTDSNLTGTIWTNAYSQYKCKVDDNGVPIAWDLSANDNIMILVDDKFVRSKSGTLAAGKCYLDVSSSSPSPAPSLVLEATPTGIEEIEMRDTRTDNQFYDLSGRKISHPTKGLYIVNGKKIIIK